MESNLGNPRETAAVAALALAGIFTPWALAGAGVLLCALEINAGIRGGREPRWWPNRWPGEPRPVKVLYDDTCNLCLASLESLKTWPTAGAMTFVPVRSPEARPLAPGLSEEALMGAMHVVEEGKVTSGADAWFRLMRLGPIEMSWPARFIPRFLARPIYAWIARNRYHWFGRRCVAANRPVSSKGT